MWWNGERENGNNVCEMKRERERERERVCLCLQVKERGRKGKAVDWIGEPFSQ